VSESKVNDVDEFNIITMDRYSGYNFLSKAAKTKTFIGSRSLI